MITRRNFLGTLGAPLLLGMTRKARGLILRGGSVAAVTGIFIPQTGYSGSGTVADGGTFTITGPGGFGTKPVSAKPLMLMLPNSTLTPSSLGRIRATASNSNSNNWTYNANGGPGGAPYMKGAPVVSGDYPGVKSWACAANITQWGTGSPNINDYGAKYRMRRQVYKNIYSYNNNNSYNIKTWRIWNETSGADAWPQILWEVVDMDLSATADAGGSPDFTPQPQFPRAGQSSGSPDYVAQQNIIAFDGGLAGNTNPVTYQNWYSEEFLTRCNQNDPGTTPPSDDTTSLQWNWYIEGLNNNNAAFTMPTDTYQWNQWYIRGPDIGISNPMVRYYFWHYIVDASSGSGRSMVPIGSFVAYGPTLLEDSWCLIECRDGATRSAFTIAEFQIPSAWTDTSVTAILRKGRFSSGERTPLIVCDNSLTEHYAGDIVWP